VHAFLSNFLGPSPLSNEAACADQSTDDETRMRFAIRGKISMKKDEEFTRVLERLRKEHEEIEALRAAADALRVLRIKSVDAHFD
jgi:hypothetical protein